MIRQQYQECPVYRGFPVYATFQIRNDIIIKRRFGIDEMLVRRKQWL